ncbi:hypothetical protein [Lysinibacillus capsici]|uniref:hypothetical protein n=1 Tax=Lysinibacillus capsici TaxID=2115968 RepID=UPI0028B1CF11|nr:hypothetical protein [Lysinibacillus capsici]
MYYSDLTEEQTLNFSHLLEYALKHQMDQLQERYPEIVKKQKLDFYRDNIIQTIMHNNLTIEEIYDWLCDLKLEGPNTVIHFEYDKLDKNCKMVNFANSIQLMELAKENILSISAKTLKKPSIVNIKKMDNETELCILLPAKKLKEEKYFDSRQHIYYQNAALYFVYVWINNEDQSFTLLLPSFSTYHSILENSNKKVLIDYLTRQIIKFLESFLGEIEYSDNTWVNYALRTITNEYYHHNNPEIDKELENIGRNKKTFEYKGKKIHFNKLLATLSEDLDNDLILKRIEKALDSAIEKELITKYKMKPCQHSFEVFLHEVDKGYTSFKSRKGQPVELNTVGPSLDTRDIIVNMLDSSSLKAIGLKFHAEGATASYKFTCKDKWFMLEQTSSTGTKKELVKSVLSKFKKYKGRGHATQRISDKQIK